eukprot:m.442469 g.442469  ORF g.442469 m.442469 type:complete len:395 (-) comp18810_c0_seq1:2272-3456(-)
MAWRSACIIGRAMASHPRTASRAHVVSARGLSVCRTASSSKNSSLFSNRPVQDAEEISHIAFAFMGSKTLFAALEIELFAKLSADLPTSFDEVSAKLPQVEPRKLETLLTALCSIGLVQRSASGLYSNPPAVEAFLSKRKPAYDFGDYLRFQIDKQMYPFMQHLSDNVAGKTSTQNFTDYSEWMADENEARLYTESQHAGSIGPAKTLSKREGDKLKTYRTMLDVGGGSGGFALTLARLYPELRLTVLDFENVVGVGREFAAKEGEVGTRVDFVAGNALESDFPPDQDGVLMSYLSSSVGEPSLSSLYTKAYNATKPGGSIFIHDFMVDDDRTGPPLAALWALQHMVFTPSAKSLNPAYVKSTLEASGWTNVSVCEMIPGMTRLAVGTKPASKM